MATDNPPVAPVEQPRAEQQMLPATKSQPPPLPHWIVLALTIAAVVTGFSTLATAILNYREALRNNLQPALPSITAYLIRPAQDLDEGEFEFIVRNDGKTAAQEIKIRQAMGLALRPNYSRGSVLDPDRSNAYAEAKSYGERSSVLKEMSKIVQRQAQFRRHPASIDVLGPGQLAVLRLEGGFLTPGLEAAIAKDKAFLVVAGSVTYFTIEGVTQEKSFCFERHPPFTAPQQKELLPICTEGMNFLFR